MTALIIIGGILLLFLLPQLPKLSLDVLAGPGGFAVKARYLCFTFDFSPEKQRARAEKKQRKSAKKAARKKPAEEAEPEEAEKRTLGELLTLARTLLRSSKKGVRTLRRHLIFSRVQVYLSVGGDDAHQTALRYSHMCMLVAAALDVVGVLFVLKKPKVAILPNFTCEEIKYEVSARIGIRSFHAVRVLLQLLFPMMGSLTKLFGRKKKTGQRKKPQRPLAKTA